MLDECNAVHEMRLAPITIRSLLFALRKQGVLTDLELKQLDLAWRRYQAQKLLDGCGKKRVIDPPTSSVPNHRSSAQANKHLGRQTGLG